MSSDACGSSLLLGLPDDIFAVVSRSLSPRDICNLCICCRSLFSLASSDKVWLIQCEMVGIVSSEDLVEWRKAVLSYRALCRFLITVRPLVGIWVHQNPELGNVVNVMPGFVSIVGCRIIPQELGPLGIEDGPILWAPVFEIIGNFDGSAAFFLHGREKEKDYVYPGSVGSIDKTCNVLLLEVEPRKQKDGGKLVHSKSEKDLSRRLCQGGNEISRSQRVGNQSTPSVPFSRLAFGDRRKLLDLVTSQILQNVPEAANGSLFPCISDNLQNFQEEIAKLFDRRSKLLQLYNTGGESLDWNLQPECSSNLTQLNLNEIRKSLDRASGFRTSLVADEVQTQWSKKKTLGGYFRSSLKQILGKSISFNGSHAASVRNGYASSETKHAQLHEFFKSGDTIGLTMQAARMKLSFYRAWPNMHESRFALYKLPMHVPTAGQEYAGLWGGTFGWPPGKPTDDKPGKALFFLLLSYEEREDQQFLIATKILEGTHYVLHPNGSAMFSVKINEPSLEPFPWDTENGSSTIVEKAYTGEGIANGYGFRYPGSKPGSLYVIQNGLLAFVWKESRVVLTLQRLNLQMLLKKGERVPALPPIANFSYLTKSYSNVFAGFSNTSNCLSSPR